MRRRNSPMRRSIVKPFLAFVASVACANLLALESENVLVRDQSRPVKEREGVSVRNIIARLHNDRVMYLLSYEALTGTPLLAGPDRQTEGVRRLWSPVRPPPTIEMEGFAPLGLDPVGNWGDLGFFNLFVNDVGFEFAEPGPAQPIGLPGHVGCRLHWRNSQAELTQTFVLRQDDDKLLMRLEVKPLAGVKIETLVLRLKNVPRMANTAYGNPATRRNAAATARGEAAPPTAVELDPASQFWAASSNLDLGCGPSGLLFLPEEVERGRMLVGAEDIQTSLVLKTSKTAFHLALWECPKVPNDQFTGYLRRNAAALRSVLAALADKDWSRELPSVADVREPLHLSDDICKPGVADEETGFILGPLDTFEYADANTLPTALLEGISVQACPGQVEPASFLIHAMRRIEKATVTASGLESADGGVIPAGQCDVRIVKVWPQVTNSYTDDTAMTPELLVRNGLMPLRGVWTDTGPGDPGLISGPAVTSVPRDQSRQVFLTIRVPEDARPGTYRGTVSIDASGRVRTVPVVLDVLPFTLASPDDRYRLGIYYRGKPFPPLKAEDPVTAEYVDEGRFARDLAGLRDLGFNTLLVFQPPKIPPVEFIDKVFGTLHKAGFRSPVIVSGWGYAYAQKFDEQTNAKHRAAVELYLRHCREKGYPVPTFYGIDEPTAGRYDGIKTTRGRAEITRQVEVDGWRGTYAVAGNTLSEFYGLVDYPVISTYYTDRKNMKQQCERYLQDGAEPLYYWQIWGEYPKGTRLNAGYFLHASGYRGVLPYVYQHFQGNPYLETRGLKNMMLVYPSADGPVATLQSEATRAGFTDLRYLLTLDDLLEKLAAKDAAKAAETRAALETLLEKYGYDNSRHWGRMHYGALNWPEHQQTVPNRQFDLDRKDIAAMILRCRELLKP